MFAALLLAPLLVFRGNVALLEDVYRSALDLPANTTATPANARLVATKLASFLHRAGYALATVRARPQGEQIVVDIDEGRLDKVIFLGGGAFETLRLRLDLNIQHDVFNQPDLEQPGSSFTFTRATGDFRYEAPSITGVLRPAVRARSELTDRQRPDLRLESFMFTTLEAGVHLVFAPVAYVRTSLGGGVQRRLLFSVEPVSGSMFTSSYDIAHTRQYAEAALELTFDPDNIRRDRHHRFGIDARVYGPPHTGEESALHVGGWYQKMFPFGWNELWVEVHGMSRTGFVLFPEEASIGGDVLRGPFGNEYARRYGELQLEFRYSLLRDVFKLGIFHNAVGYGAIDRVTNKDKLTGANAVGLGIHALLIDEFQLDAWFGVGWSTKKTFDQGAALAIRQAF